MSKNIETCKSEEVLSSVLDQQPQDYPSVQQAVHDLGVTALPAASAADPDIAELPSNVDVFVRRVLKAVVYDRVLPVVQQMWQAVLNRISSPNYTPYSLYPYASNPSLRTLGTLPTALSALSPRKISNGGATNDGIKDGVSLAHLLLSSEAASVTELKDEQGGWDYEDGRLATLLTWMPNVTTLTLGMKKIKGNGKMIKNNTKLEGTIRFPNLKEYGKPTADSDNGIIYGCPNVTELDMSQMESIDHYSRNDGDAPYAMIGNMQGLVHVKFGKLTKLTGSWTGAYNYIIDCPALIDLEIGAGTAISMNWKYWAPTLTNDNLTTFLQNFLHHIAERLAVGPTTNRLTLTLSADVYSACGFGATIDDQTDIRYLIKKAIQDRNWKVTDGTNNFNQ